MQDAAAILSQLGVEYELTIVSAHRTPDRLVDYGKNVHKNGIGVVIAGAGGAAHLPGMIAAFTHLPVIGVPVKSSNMSGLDSLYSIVQMPPGVPVATVAINGARNAGILAAQIIGISNEDISKSVIAFKTSMNNEVLEKAAKVEEIGYQEYLNLQK